MRPKTYTTTYISCVHYQVYAIATHPFNSLGEELFITVRGENIFFITLSFDLILRQLFGEEESEAELDKAEKDGENRMESFLLQARH